VLSYNEKPGIQAIGNTAPARTTKRLHKEIEELDRILSELLKVTLQQ